MEIVCDAKENVDGLVVVTEQPGKTQFKNLIACLRKKGFFLQCLFFRGCCQHPLPHALFIHPSLCMTLGSLPLNTVTYITRFPFMCNSHLGCCSGVGSDSVISFPH